MKIGRCDCGRGDGAGDRNRTCDLRVTSALLYRLSYTGVFRVQNLPLLVGTGNRW